MQTQNVQTPPKGSEIDTTAVQQETEIKARSPIEEIDYRFRGGSHNIEQLLISYNRLSSAYQSQSILQCNLH